MAQWRTASVAAPVLGERLGPIGIEGRVVRVEAVGRNRRLALDRARIERLDAERIPLRVRIRVPGREPDVTPGAWVRALAILAPPPPPVAPGAFDFQRQSYFRQLGAVGFSLGRPHVLAREAVSGPMVWVETVRQAIGARIGRALSGERAAVARALMIGDRGAIPDSVIDALRDSGLAHLLAISGLHIGLVAGIVFFGVRAGLALVPSIALRFPIKKWAAAAAVLAALGYALVAGATVPTQRAFLMIGLVLLAVMVDRRGLTMRSVAMAATVILLFRPESLLGASFQLSFAAVTALIAVYEVFRVRPIAESAPWGGILIWRAGGLYRGGCPDHPGRGHGDGTLCGLSFQPGRGVRFGRQSGGRAGHGPVDHALGGDFGLGDAVRPGKPSIDRHGVGNRRGRADRANGCRMARRRRAGARDARLGAGRVRVGRGVAVPVAASVAIARIARNGCRSGVVSSGATTRFVGRRYGKAARGARREWATDIFRP